MDDRFTPRELELIRITAKEVMAEAGHICHFSETSRKRMHAFNDIMEQEKADSGTLLVMIQTAKGIQDVTKKALRYFIIALAVIVFSVFGGALLLR